MNIHLRFLGNSLLAQLIRAVILAISFLSLSVLASLVGLLNLHRDKKTRMAKLVTVLRGCILVMHDFLIGKLIIKGKENLSVKHPVIYVSNHESYWDAIVMPIILCPTIFVIKKYVLFLPIAGWVIAVAPKVQVDSKKDKKRGIRLCQKKIKEVLLEGLNILFYAQGTRVSSTERVPFKKGASILAIETDTPIVPICLNSLKIWSGFCFTKTGDVTISVGKPISPKGKTPEELTAELEHWIYNERTLID